MECWNGEAERRWSSLKVEQSSGFCLSTNLCPSAYLRVCHPGSLFICLLAFPCLFVPVSVGFPVCFCLFLFIYVSVIILLCLFLSVYQLSLLPIFYSLFYQLFYLLSISPLFPFFIFSFHLSQSPPLSIFSLIPPFSFSLPLSPVLRSHSTFPSHWE